MSERGAEIERFILQNVRKHPEAIASVTAERFKISRQAVNRHVSKLVAGGQLEARGHTRARSYELKVLDRHSFAEKITPSLAEDSLWEGHVRPWMPEMDKELSDICFYGFTEMCNNAIDHSEGSRVQVDLLRTAVDVTMRVADDGVGIFNKVARALNLSDPRQSLLELSKGKFTTDPERHTGLGIFYTSRTFDRFLICSGDLTFYHGFDGDDWLFTEEAGSKAGTGVTMEISLTSTRRLNDVFDRFSSATEDDHGFTKTHVPLKLARFGELNLISRSQAKRVLARVDRFKEVMLDFEGVEMIGQGFADEIFRVFARHNPGVTLVPVNTNAVVRKMIAFVQAESPIAPPAPPKS